MRFYISVIIFNLFAIISYCSEKVGNSLHYPHANQIDTIKHDGIIRTFKLYIPASYSDTIKSALVIALHGYGNTATEMEEACKLNDKADSEGFIIVYPDGFNYSKDANETQYWNASRKFDRGKKRIDDVGFISNMIDEICKYYSIDKNRIFATGFSNGASMCYHLGRELSCKIAAIAPHSGYMIYNPKRVTKCKVPVLHIHGLKDGIAKYNEKWIEYVLCHWESKDACKQVADTTIQNGDYLIKEWISSGTRLYLSNIGKHDWFNSQNSCIEANDIIWDFFKEHPKKNE